MRILFWSGNFWPVVGGAEVRAAKLLPALQERGYEFLVVTSHTSPNLPREARFNGIPVHRFAFWKSYNNVDELMTVRQQVARLKRAFAPDLVHRNSVGVGDFFHLTTVNAHSTPVLLTLVNDLRFQSLERDTSVSRMLRSADWVNSVSAAVLARARRLVPEITLRSSVIHNGLETRLYRPGPLPDAPRLLCLGRLHTQKGFDLALRAIASIIGRFPALRLTIAGDGPERRALERQTAQLNLTHAVDFVGWVVPEEVPALINTAMAVVMPSRWEGLPGVALQAALMARPVVATGVGGLPEVIEHQKTGLLVAKDDVAALAGAISSVLAHPATAAQMGQAARTQVQNLFGWERYVDAYDALYRQLIGNGRRNSVCSKSPQTSSLSGA